MRFSLTITFNITFDLSLGVSNSTVRATMIQNYRDLVSAIMSAADLTVLGYESVTFSSGSIKATSELMIVQPPKNDEVIALINSTYNEDPTVIALAKSTKAISVDTDAVNECSEEGRTTCNSEFSECLTMDAFPGFECKCQVGYRDTNTDNPGTSCEEQCVLGEELYCQNGATCSHTAAQNPNCLCTQWYQGERCESLNPLIIGLIAGLVIAAVVILLLCVVVCAKRRPHRGSSYWNPRRYHHHRRSFGGSVGSGVSDRFHRLPA